MVKGKNKGRSFFPTTSSGQEIEQEEEVNSAAEEEDRGGGSPAIGARIRPPETEGLLGNTEIQNSLGCEPSLRSVLSDPLSGAFLEDAVVVSCGHSFGGHMLKKVLELARCNLCNVEIDTGSLIPNLALRAAAGAVRNEDERRLFHNSTLRKRRREGNEHVDLLKKPVKENGEMNGDSNMDRRLKGVQFPFSVNEKVLIKGNRRTPDKFVGREAVITSLCLNGWYLLKLLDSGESVRLQYRSLQKLVNPQDGIQPLSVQPLALIESNNF